MGGNALKEHKPMRLTSEQVVNLFNGISRNWAIYSATPLYLVPWVGEKADHGDIDIVVCGSVDGVKEFLGLNGIKIVKQNDTVLSAGWPVPWEPGRIAQVDFIAPPSFTPACFFYSGGDFGMMLGRVCACHGFVFGIDGLRLRADPKVPWMKDVLLTYVPRRIMEVLEYKYPIPYFRTYEDLWLYVLSSPLAEPWMFLPDATNAENRNRDKQRPRIKDFQAWIRKSYDVESLPCTERREGADMIEWCEELGFKHVAASLRNQETLWKDSRLINHKIGLGAVDVVVRDAAALTKAQLGAVVREMQRLLPKGRLRHNAIMGRQLELIRLARLAAWTTAKHIGFAVVDPKDIPEVTEADYVKMSCGYDG